MEAPLALLALRLVRRAARRRREARRLRIIRENAAHMRHLRDASNPFELPAGTFIGKYRLNQEMARALIEELRPHMKQAQRSTAVPVEIKVLAALNFFGHGSDQKGVACDLSAPLCQSSVSNAVDEVCSAMSVPVVLCRHVKFPSTNPEFSDQIRRNYKNLSMPGVVGYVDGFHVHIVAPSTHEDQYVNRKGNHSLNAQIVANCDMLILNILARYPGSSHDSFIWANSTVREVMEETYRERMECWLIGDSGYPHEPWLQVPILDAPEGSAEANFTKAHMIDRSVVERTIGHLRARFRCLSKHRVLHYDPLKVGKITNACVILHNMCVRANLPNDEEMVGEEMDSDDENAGLNIPQPPFLAPQLPQPQRRFRSLREEAFVVRESIIARVPRVGPRQWEPRRRHRRQPQ